MKKIASRLSVLIMLSLFVVCPSIASDFNVLDFGAKGDGKQMETDFIQKAIDKANENGGVVVFPSGDYVSGTIYLKDNVTLHLQKGATILGSRDLSDYPENIPEYNFFRKGIIKRALIFAEQKENISIIGEGTIDGQGYAFSEPKDKKVSSYSVRPYVIWMVQCEKVRVEGIKLQNSALWMQHYLACENVRIHNIEVYNHSNKNNDMMDIDGCKDVIISDCRGDTDDDGITLKSTHAKPNENITITNCIISSHCNAIKCGTESNAGFKNITISNCIIKPSSDTEVIYGKPAGISGISLEVVDGATMDGVNISNIVMDGPEVPLFIRLGNRARGYDKSLSKPDVGSLQNVMISNITAFNAKKTGSSITGIPGHPVKNISMENIRIHYAGGGSGADAKKTVDERESKYPEATMFGVLPSYGMFIRHARSITMRNIEFFTEAADDRPPIILEDVQEGSIENLKATIHASVSMVMARAISEISILNPQPSSVCQSVINIAGAGSKSIKLTAIDKRKFHKLFMLSDGAKQDEVSLGTVYD